MNNAPVTIEEVVVAILELAKRKLNEEELADLVSAGRLHEVLPYRPRLQVPTVLERWEDTKEAPARELTDEEYRQFLRGGDTPVLLERTVPAPHSGSEPSEATQHEAKIISTPPRAKESVLHAKSSGEIARAAIEQPPASAIALLIRLIRRLRRRMRSKGPRGQSPLQK